MKKKYKSSVSPILYVLFASFLNLWVNNRKLAYPVMVVLFFGIFFKQCKKDEPASYEIQLVEMNETIGDLEPGTTYYWKVRAQTVDQNTFKSETISRYFIIAE